MTPVFTMVRNVEFGVNNAFLFRVRYPDGSVWWDAVLQQMRGDRIARATIFFAPDLHRREWALPFTSARPAQVATK